MSGITTTIGSLPQYIATATVPALTTVFTPPASCSNRWLAADNPSIAWSTYSRDGYTPPVDPIYYSCLPERLRGPHYSPGVCTDGQTIAGITKYEAGARTMWQAQCCKSGLTISIQTVQGSAAPMCVSSIATPLAVRALVTTTYTNGASSFYELVINDKSTISSISTLSRGTAVADPLYVAWEASDLSLFPVGYATLLAQKIGVSFTPTATPASAASSRRVSQTGSSADPSQSGDGGSASSSTSTSDPGSSGLSSTAKIGIGVGVGVAAVLLLSLIGMAFIIRRLRRRNKAVTSYPNETTPAIQSHDAGIAKNKWYQRTQPNVQPEVNSGVNELDSFPLTTMHGPPVELEGSYHHTGRY
ncbi:hypothetical protein CC86DRAFT_379163 [Ophiobolus disseminans]|uniref:Mid2 domain-containing protein n=1 Tax=Ophiobolus disseminans TaxID=1469910 RepID=A0A6A7AAH9_9PLEO|nr:hypothetical protein CC86DRAFT_379163 [Ophiobolus disseminans]